MILLNLMTLLKKKFGINLRKMKTIVFYVLILFIGTPSFAQKEASHYNQEKLESAKVAFITKRLNLSPQQAEKFWPLYNQHNEEKGKLMRQINELSKAVNADIDDKKALHLIDRKFELKKEILDLENVFTKNIVEIISPVQAIKLSDINRDFARHIYRMQKGKKRNND